MDEKEIRVIAHAGYRSEESPRAFFLKGTRVDVVKLLDQWIEQTPPARNNKRYFKVKGSDFRAHTLYYDEELMAWFYCN